MKKIWESEDNNKLAETVHYSGREDDLHYEGVAIIIRKGMDVYLLEWKLLVVNSRIIQACLNGRHAG